MAVGWCYCPITTVTFPQSGAGAYDVLRWLTDWVGLSVNRRRVISAFIVAPIAVPIVFSAPVLIHLHVLEFLAGIVMVSIYALPVAYIFELLIGVPAWILFRVFRLKSFVAFALGGAVIGLLVDAILKIPSGSLCDWSLSDVPYVLAALGSALLFRAIAFQGTAAQGG